METSFEPNPPPAADGPLLGRGRRVVIGIVAAAVMASVIAWNVPDPDVRISLHNRVRPLVYTLGLEQSWALFAPNPPGNSMALVADVHFANGSTERFTFPDGDPLIGALREYRWRKMERRVQGDGYRSQWAPTARWVAGHYDEAVARVVLIRRLADSPEPGSDEPLIWIEDRVFTLTLDEEGAGG